ncbi:hypothetical protein C8R43DRAFT_1191752 [Mycena crocata]|nr:hypothetical protein C8R43DRAFT_1191752 [Mycena crocata]
MLLLPSSPLTLCYDRFSLADSDTDEPIPFWPILHKILVPAAESTSQLIEVLDTIAVTLRGSSDSDNIFLRRFLDEWDADTFFQETWPRCVEIALQLPDLFPDGHPEPLTSQRSSQAYSSRHITCLVMHQLLCTLPKLPWIASTEEDNSQDLHIWYGGEQPHPNAVTAYLTALFTFLDRATLDAELTHPISLTLYSAPHTPHPDATTLFQTLIISDLETPSVNTSLLGLPSGACVISANSHIGFGRTASQEEMHVGCSPQSLPAKLFTPPLKADEVMVLRGCEALIEIAGYGRSAALAAILPAGTSTTTTARDWSQRTMLFMDALELDSYDTSDATPDLLPGNVDREFTKAYTAFASYGEAGPYETVVTGHWGCRAFGGNREIKSMIQWCAASMARVHLNFVCEKNDPFAANFRSFTSEVLQRGWTVHAVLAVLRGMPSTDPGGKYAFAHVRKMLAQVPE